MGKFYDAMQRARQREPERTPDDPAAMPDLDSGLFYPEAGDGSSIDVESLGPAEHPDSAHHETPSAVLRAIESSVADRKPERQTESRITRVDVSGPAELSIEAVRPPVFSLNAARVGARELFRTPVETVVRVHPAFDRVIQRLMSFRRTPRQGVVLMTGSVAGEGTSTVARNVATALSQSGSERVLLLDANLRSPSQHEAYRIAREGGFSELLQEEIALGAAVRDDLGSGVSLMPAGAPVRSPSLVLKGGTVTGVITALLSIYDWIILDSPPATAYPDVATLGSACGAGILVVRAESTRLEVAEAARSVLEHSGTHVLGAVLNRRHFHIPEAIYRRL